MTHQELNDSRVTSESGNVEGCKVISVPVVDTGTLVNEEFGNLIISTPCSLMQRRAEFPGLQIDVCATVKKQLGHINVSLYDSRVQRSEPAPFGLIIDAGPIVEQNVHHWPVPKFRSY